jgi:hypothetical protein
MRADPDRLTSPDPFGMPREPRVAGSGALYLGWGVLSRAQLRLLLALAATPAGFGRREVAAVLWGVAVNPGRRSALLTPAQRSSRARTIRRLHAAGLVETLGNVRLSPEGWRLVDPLAAWDGWAVYLECWPDVSPAEPDRRVVG